MRLYGTIEKVDKERRLVSGYASTEDVDAHGEIVLKSAVEAALDDYLDFANLREMHQLSAVGTTEEATVDDKGLYITAKVVDDAAWKKVTTGVYKGFSIGGKVLARDPKSKKTITKIRLDEISLVDRPSNPESKFDLWRAAGAAPLDKSLSNISSFVYLLKSLLRLADHAEFEDGADAEIPVALRSWLKAGLQILKNMAEGEFDEFVAAAMTKSASVDADGPFAKVTAALRAADDKIAALQSADASDAILKAFAAKDAKIAALEKRIDDILAEPLPAKTASQYGLIAVSKEADAAGNGTIGKAAPSGDDLIAVLQAMPEEDRALLLTKAALQLPRPATMVTR